MFLEYVTGFEPVNNGFADRPFRPLRHTYIKIKPYYIAATEELRLYEDCITFGITSLQGFTHLLARRIILGL